VGALQQKKTCKVATEVEKIGQITIQFLNLEFFRGIWRDDSLTILTKITGSQTPFLGLPNSFEKTSPCSYDWRMATGWDV